MISSKSAHAGNGTSLLSAFGPGCTVSVDELLLTEGSGKSEVTLELSVSPALGSKMLSVMVHHADAPLAKVATEQVTVVPEEAHPAGLLARDAPAGIFNVRLTLVAVCGPL